MVSKKRNPLIYWSQTDTEVNIKIDLRLDDMVSGFDYVDYYYSESISMGNKIRMEMSFFFKFTEAKHQNQSEVFTAGRIRLWIE